VQSETLHDPRNECNYILGDDKYEEQKEQVWHPFVHHPAYKCIGCGTATTSQWSLCPGCEEEKQKKEREEKNE